jgi:hypothetical protein
MYSCGQDLKKCCAEREEEREMGEEPNEDAQCRGK